MAYDDVKLLKSALEAIARHPDVPWNKSEVYKIAADALGWTRRFDEVDRKRYFIGDAVQNALIEWWAANPVKVETGAELQDWPAIESGPPYSLRVALSQAVHRAFPDTTLYVVFKEGVYNQGCHGVFNSLDKAIEAADQVAAEEPDDYHHFDVLSCTLNVVDGWALEGVHYSVKRSEALAKAKVAA